VYFELDGDKVIVGNINNDNINNNHNINNNDFIN